MATKANQFGKVTVYVTEVDAGDDMARVEVNWGTSGSVSVTEAVKFFKHFNHALDFALAEAERLDVKVSVIDWESLTNA